MANTSTTAMGVTLSDVSAAATLQPRENFAASNHLSNPDKPSNRNMQPTIWGLKEGVRHCKKYAYSLPGKEDS